MNETDLRDFQNLGGLWRNFHTPNNMIMRRHQAVHQHIRDRDEILFDLLQEEKIVFRLEEDPLAVVAAIVDVIMQFRDERD